MRSRRAYNIQAQNMSATNSGIVLKYKHQNISTKYNHSVAPGYFIHSTMAHRVLNCFDMYSTVAK